MLIDGMWLVCFIAGAAVLVSFIVLGSSAYLEQRALISHISVQQVVPLPMPRPTVKKPREEIELVRELKPKASIKPKAGRR